MTLLDTLADLLTYHREAPMLFSSGLFLWLFLIFSSIYALLRQQHRARTIFVILFSYYFYYKSSGWYLFVLALVTITDFLIGRQLSRHQRGSFGARALLALSILIDLGLLCYFKYTNFLGSLLIDSWTDLDIILPVGVSFFIFQTLSYTIDIYRGRIQPLDSLLDYAFYISFFPQLVAGPIVRACDFIPQIRSNVRVTDEMFTRGAMLIMLGVIKKAVISDYISINFVDRIFEAPLLFSNIENLLGIYGYTLQIYCDFSGYSDMAIGIALWLGFHFPKNFDSPYKSLSVTEFWRRWHISLSFWLRDYLYISLGGNRKGRLRQYLNLMITMTLGGLWHGASMKFVIWGMLHGFFLCLDKMWMSLCDWFLTVTSLGKSRLVTCGFSRFLAKSLGFLLTFHLVAAGWVLFRAENMTIARQIFTKVASGLEFHLLPVWAQSYPEVALTVIFGYALHFIPARISDRIHALRIPFWCLVLMFAFVIWFVIKMKGSQIVPFIYFDF